MFFICFWYVTIAVSRLSITLVKISMLAPQKFLEAFFLLATSLEWQISLYYYLPVCKMQIIPPKKQLKIDWIKNIDIN